ncbi:nicotinate-nucleotide--dimethylbenzimidazole phosphoribosyltransferase [Aquipuribacter sp. SD81]|uniref:nicotinate-nucleotide--dimethylbenzimidazole phosphoribosyltransferase n=1 Tax=Aquipuribacter sp. SD81 TaxID=3127703 RepID=UPI003016AEE0
MTSATPAEPPDDLVEATGPDLHGLATGVRPPSRAAEQRARARLDTLLLPPDGLGSLQRLALWWAAVRDDETAPPPASVEAVVLAADHGVAVRGVSALPLGHTAVSARALRDGRAATSAVAGRWGVPVRLVAVDVAGPHGPEARPLDSGDVMDTGLLSRSVALGSEVADELVAAGRDLVVLGDLGVGSTTTAAAAVGAVLRRPVLDVVGRGSGVDDTAWMRKAAAVREGLRRARARSRDVTTVLRTVGSPDLAAAVALLLRCSAAGLPVVLDGPLVVAAAVLANRVSPTARQWWLVAERTDEPCVHRALETFAMTPVLDLGVRAGSGLAGLLAVQALGAAVAVQHGTVTSAEAWPAVETPEEPDGYPDRQPDSQPDDDADGPEGSTTA